MNQKISSEYLDFFLSWSEVRNGENLYDHRKYNS